MFCSTQGNVGALTCAVLLSHAMICICTYCLPLQLPTSSFQFALFLCVQIATRTRHVLFLGSNHNKTKKAATQKTCDMSSDCSQYMTRTCCKSGNFFCSNSRERTRQEGCSQEGQENERFAGTEEGENVEKRQQNSRR